MMKKSVVYHLSQGRLFNLTHFPAELRLLNRSSYLIASLLTLMTKYNIKKSITPCMSFFMIELNIDNYFKEPHILSKLHKTSMQ